MATKKLVQKRFNVSYRIVADLGMDIEADSLESALEIARAQKIGDILDLSSLDHNDSEDPKVTGIFEVGA